MFLGTRKRVRVSRSRGCRMLVVDFLDMRLRVVKLRGRDAKCAVCGDAPTITDVAGT